jgi:hypothetical protein
MLGGHSGDLGQERRKSARHRAFKAGRIVFGNLSMTLDVTIRDVSDDGARLTIDANANLPTDFYFVVVADQLVTRAQLAWRNAREAGITYL